MLKTEQAAFKWLPVLFSRNFRSNHPLRRHCGRSVAIRTLSPSLTGDRGRVNCPQNRNGKVSILV
jgi:hypothetical protein